MKLYHFVLAVLSYRVAGGSSHYCGHIHGFHAIYIRTEPGEKLTGGWHAGGCLRSHLSLDHRLSYRDKNFFWLPFGEHCSANGKPHAQQLDKQSMRPAHASVLSLQVSIPITPSPSRRSAMKSLGRKHVVNHWSLHACGQGMTRKLLKR